jgi:hypothetical protein
MSETHRNDVKHEMVNQRLGSRKCRPWDRPPSPQCGPIRQAPGLNLEVNMACRPARRLLRVSFLALTLLAILAAGAVATGQVGYMITNGVSMNPLYHQGDLVVLGKS